MDSRKIIDTLNGILSESDAVFSELASALPALLSELNTSLSGADDLIRAMGMQNREGTSHSQLRNHIDSIRKGIENADGRFSHLHLQNMSVFQNLKESFSVIEELNEDLKTIQHYSEDIKIISLNAIIAAQKSGKAGAAFSVITQEMRRLSNKIITLCEELQLINGTVQENSLYFKEMAAVIIDKEKDLINEFTDTVNQSIEKSINDSQKAIRFMEELTGKASRVRPPLYSIMENVQYHDILSQSVHHLILTIKETERGMNSDDLKGINRRNYQSRVIGLCIHIIREIQSAVNEKYLHFADGIDQIQAVIHDLMEDQKSFQFSSDRSAQIFIEQLRTTRRDSYNSKQELFAKGTVMIDKITALKENLDGFSEIATSLFNIILFSRIEVAKQSRLRSMEASVEDMDRIINAMKGEIDKAIHIAGAFLERVSMNMSDYVSLSEEKTSFLIGFLDASNNHLEQFSRITGQIQRMNVHYHRFTEKFVPILNRAAAEIEGLNHCVLEINLIEQELSAELTVLEKFGQGINDENAEGDPGTEELENLMRKFTIFSQKEYAGQIGNIDIEEKSLSKGEITLF